MKNIVVTGYGSISSLGNNSVEFSKNLLAEKNGILRYTKDIDCLDCNEFALGLIHDFDFDNYIAEKKFVKLNTYSQYALNACSQALSMSKLSNNLSEFRNEVGVIVANTYVGLSEIIDNLQTYVDKGVKHITPFKCLVGTHMILSAVCGEFSLPGYNVTVNSSISAGYSALQIAYNRIMRNKDEKIIILGIDPINDNMIKFANRLGLSSRNNKCCPFDASRDGLVMGEACGVLIVESLESAVERNADIYCAINGIKYAGGGSIKEKLRGGNLYKSIVALLNEIGSEDTIDFIFANSNSTRSLDLINGCGIKRVQEILDKKIPVCASKSFIGETISAGGIMDVITAIVSMENKFLPKIHSLSDIPAEFSGLDLLTKSISGPLKSGVIIGTGLDGDCYSVHLSRAVN